jgi:hypothetical protein
MTIEERKQAAAIALDQARSRVSVIIHIGTADAQSTVELAEHAAAHRPTLSRSCRRTITPIIPNSRSIALTKRSRSRVVADFYLRKSKIFRHIDSSALAVRMKEQVPMLKESKSHMARRSTGICPLAA